MMTCLRDGWVVRACSITETMSLADCWTSPLCWASGTESEVGDVGGGGLEDQAGDVKKVNFYF